MDIENPILRKLYALDGDAEEIREAYRDWARSYDKDTTEGMGYVAPNIAAAALARRVGPDAEILDAGCGTGLTGEELKKLGMTRIDGNDISGAMLDVARKKDAYRHLERADLTEKLDIEPNRYDGVVCVGVFTSGHVGPDALEELARVARPGAPIVATVHEHVWESDGYPAHIEGMDRAGIIDIEEVVDAPYHEKEGYRCRLCVLRAA